MPKNKSWTKKYCVFSETWTKAFFTSHVLGWIIACLQTLWIVWEVRNKKR